jgi:hypothetical protein
MLGEGGGMQLAADSYWSFNALSIARHRLPDVVIEF